MIVTFILMTGEMILWEMDPVLDNPRLFLSHYLDIQPNRLILSARTEAEEYTYNVFISPASSVWEWIDEDCLDSVGLCENSNPKIVDYLRQHPEHLIWFAVNANPVCTDLLFDHPEHIDIKWLCKNSHPRAVQYTLDHIASFQGIQFIECVQHMCTNSNPDIIRFLSMPQCLPHLNWVFLSLNECPEVVTLFERYPDRVIWSVVGMNRCEQVASFIVRNIHRMTHNMNVLCSNPSTVIVDYLLDHPQQIEFVYFSSNCNDKAVDALLHVFYDDVCWETFAQNKNPRAIQYVYENLHRIKPVRLWYLLLEQGEHGVSYWLQHLDIIRDLFHHITHSSRMMSSSWVIPILYEFRHCLTRKNVSWFSWYCLSKNSGIFI